MTQSFKSCRERITTAFDVPFLRALADPVRVRILGELSEHPDGASVSALTGCCGIDFSGVSRHLKHLREAGLVSAEKHGRETRYLLNREGAAMTLNAMANALRA